MVAVTDTSPEATAMPADNGETTVRVPQATDRERAAAVVTVRSDNGDVVVDD
jgi:hypothetical protein